MDAFRDWHCWARWRKGCRKDAVVAWEGFDRPWRAEIVILGGIVAVVFVM